MIIQADAARLPLKDKAVQLTCGSPPYCGQRLYLEEGRDLGIARDTEAWVAWMLDVTAEALRVTDGAVIWVIGCPTRGRNYQPAAEGLAWEWFRRGGSMYRPVYWHRVGIPGSGGDQWMRADVEYCLCFKRPGPLPWAEPTAMGKPPKYLAGGPCTNRAPAWQDRSRRGDGRRRAKAYAHPEVANPGNVVRTGAGKGHMGDDMAHENEAPFPERVAEFFIRSLCPPDGICLDPFAGSHTTPKVAKRLGRRWIGSDLRWSQCQLGKRRMACVQREMV